MYNPLDRHGSWNEITYWVDNGEEEIKMLRKRIDKLEKENEALKHRRDYVDIVKEIFEHTEKEMFMGGLLQVVYPITDDILFINSKFRMDANMMATLRNHLNGRILCGSVKGDVLVILCGVRHYDKESEKE